MALPAGVLPFCPRKWQLPLIEDAAPRIVAVVHRRAGKSTALIWRAIKRAVQVTAKRPRQPARVAMILPYLVQWTRTGLWDQLVAAAESVPGARVEKSAWRVILPGGGVIQAGGADNPDAWRGGGADEVILDEIEEIPRELVTLVIEPMLADRGGTMVISGTPKGIGHLSGFYDKAGAGAGWSRYRLRWQDTGVLNAEAIERLRDGMTKEEFAQELECSFDAPNTGSYYGKDLEAAEREGRICAVPYNPALRVTTAWDLGIDDSTAIWFAQRGPAGDVRVIDYYEVSGAGFPEIARELAGRAYVYDRHLLPHDAAVRELGTGKSRVETLAGLGIRADVVAAQNVADGINAARLLLPRCWFDAARTAAGRKLLATYRREWNEKLGVWRSTPRHDASSHAADAFRYLALGWKDTERKPLRMMPRGGGWQAA